MLCNMGGGPLASEVASDQSPDIGAARHAANGVAGDDLTAEVVAHKPANR